VIKYINRENRMSEVAIKLPKEKIIEGLSTLSLTEIKGIMDILIQNKLFKPPSARKIYKETSQIVIKEKLSPKVAEEAIKWARDRK
jgi:hypothetical protein